MANGEKRGPLEKFLPPLSDGEHQELERIGHLQLATLNEQDVREEYLAPIVRLLGYGSGTDYDVRRGESFPLSPPFVMFGHHRYQLDYQFIVWKQGFWLLEAKSAETKDPDNPPELSAEDVGQAFAYALHPQVDAPYFAVSNGWWLKLYERDVDDPTEPFISIRQSELAGRFDELRRILAADQITLQLERRLLRRIQQVLSANVYLERCQQFGQEVQRIIATVRPQVMANSRNLWLKAELTLQQSVETLLKERRADQILDEVLLMTPLTQPRLQQLGDAFVKNVRLNESLGYLFFARLFLEEARPVTTDYYIKSLYVLGALAANRDHPSSWVPQALRQDGHSTATPSELFSWWSEILLQHLVARPELRMAWALEALLGRVTKRFLVYAPDARQTILSAVDSQRYFFPEELVALMSPSPAVNVLLVARTVALSGIGLFLQQYYDSSKRDWKGALANDEYRKWLEFERELERATPDYLEKLKAVGDQWHEIPALDIINKPFDQLGAGVCVVLKAFPELLRNLPERCHGRIAFLAGLRVNFAKECCDIIGKSVDIIDPDQARIEVAKFFDPTRP